MIDISQPLKGEMNGHKFTVKPKSLLSRKVDKELKEDMKKWQQENNAEYLKWSKDNSEKIQEALKENDLEMFQDAPTSKDWLEDEEFRANRFKKMADACMKFKDQPKPSIWKSDEIEYGVIELAWDFFTGKQEMPTNTMIS